MTGPETKLRSKHTRFAPPDDSISEKIFSRDFVVLQKMSADSDLAYFTEALFPKCQVQFVQISSDSVKAAINKRGSAFKNLCTEATGRRGKIERRISVRRSVGYTDQNEAYSVLDNAITVNADRIVWDLKKENCPSRGLYVIQLDGEWLYVGRSEKSLLARADSHFHAMSPMVQFDKYCQKNLSKLASAQVWLVAPDLCQTIVKKSLFFDIEEYETYSSQIDDEYQAWIKSDPKRYLLRAESALIEALSPKYNLRGNIFSASFAKS